MSVDPAQYFGPRVIRPSSLTTLADCERRWAAHALPDEVAQAGFVLHGRRPTHVGAAVGTGVHAAAAYTMEAKIADGTLGNETEAIDRAEEGLKAQMTYGVAWDAITADLPTAQKQVARMAKTYRRFTAPNVEPLLVERRLEGDVGDGWSVSGQLDTLQGDPDSVLRDLKTGAHQRANHVQYGMYAMLFRSHGYRVDRLAEDFIRRASLRKEQPLPVEVTIDIESAVSDAWESVRTIKATTAEFHRRLADPNGPPPEGAFRPNPASQLCGEKWCNAWGTQFCKAHKK